MMYAGLPLPLLVALVGATIIFCRGQVFARVRSVWPTFLACPLCIGFWVGAGGGLRAQGWRAPLDLVLDGSTVAICSLAADAWLGKHLGDPT